VDEIVIGAGTTGAVVVELGTDGTVAWQLIPTEPHAG
jgi:hypothetical protein